MIGFVPLRFSGGLLVAVNRGGDLLDLRLCHRLRDAT
jgi:hypothetical protein